MKAVDQTRLGFGQDGDCPGNCWAACIASILEFDLDEIPDEEYFWKPGMTAVESWNLYQPVVREWLKDRGIALIHITFADDAYFRNGFDPLCIISGPSPRNPEFQHAVVGHGDKIIHDPHPSRAGVIATDRSKLSYEFFIARNPKKIVYEG